MRIPLSAPDIQEEEIASVSEVLRSSRLSLGPKLREFEQTLAGYVRSERAIAVSSGTAGLHLCIRALGIGPGDEVIVPSFSFVAVANAVRYENATPVFVDVEPATLNLDSGGIEAALTPRTKMVLAVHTFGCPAEMAQILQIARQNNLYVIEDACEAMGAEYDGKKAGTHGDAGVFAFYPNKQITTGEGGAVITADAKLGARLRSLRNQGRAECDDWFQHSEVGYNYRLAEVNCALGITQLKRIEAILTCREEIARKYHEKLGAQKDLRLPPLTAPRRRISWFVFVVRLGEHFSRSHRDWIVSEMNRRGIGCGRYFAPIHLQPAYQGAPGVRSSLTVTERESARCLALPFFNRLKDEQIHEVCETLTALLKEAARLAPSNKAVSA